MQNHLPIWAQQKLSSTGENVGNPDDPRRTRSDFQRAGIALSCANNLLSKNCYLMISSDIKSYYNAWKDPRWQVSMDEEMNSLQKNTTWELVSLHPWRKLVQCKWVFQTKVAVNGRNYKYKEILVEKGFSLVQGVDYHETFALVAKMDSISLVLAISASKHWEMHHMDVK